MVELAPEHPNAALLQSATKGFDYLFSNNIDSAREHFKQHQDDPFHLMGLGVCAFLEAALGMESGLMTEATRCLSLSEAGTRREMRVTKPREMAANTRFSYGLEWEILNADAVVLLGLTHALGESYMGYLQCMYSLNSAHSKFTKLYKTVFPNGIPTASHTAPLSNLSVSPSLPASLHHKPSVASLISTNSSIAAPAPAAAVKPTNSFFSRWVSNAVASASSPSLPLTADSGHILPDGPVEDLIVAGTAFGFGLFNLVFSLLPKKIQGLVGFFGFKHDRKLALQALALSATKHDVHGIFAGLVLMTYHGAVLLFSGYQADEGKILEEYRAIVDKIASKYPEGALWILNRAKIMRMSYDAEGAISVLQNGLQQNRVHSFVQADMLLLFELAWTQLGQRRYPEAAESFMKITELNSWSHGTYYFIAAGCHLAVGNHEKAQKFLDAIPELMDKRKISGKDLPTEVFIKKKLAFYKEKQIRRTGDEKNYAQAVSINLADEIGIFWNNHARVGALVAQAHIDGLAALTPPVRTTKSTFEASSPTKGKGYLQSSKTLSTAASPTSPTPNTLNSPRPLALAPAVLDLDTADELAIRALLLGINYRTLGNYEVARDLFNESYDYQARGEVKVSTWVGGVAMFELAVLDLKEAEGRTARGVSGAGDGALTLEGKADGGVSPGDGLATKMDSLALKLEEEVKHMWVEALMGASAKLEEALSLATSSVDLSSRLDSRIAMLKDEIASKKEMLVVTF